MFDYIDILIQALYNHDEDFLSGDYFLQYNRETQAEDALWETFSEEQKQLYLKAEYERSVTETSYTEAFARQIFLLAREIYC